MVLVAAVALGSATFAWFVNNNRVEATGVDLAATSSVPNLYIESVGKTTGTVNATTKTAAVKGQKLYPVSTVNGNNFFETLAWETGTNGHTMANSYQIAQTVDGDVQKYGEYTFTLGVQNGSMDIYFDVDTAKTAIKDAGGIGAAGRWAISVDDGKTWKLFKATTDTSTTTGYVTDANPTNLSGDWAVEDANSLKNVSYDTIQKYAAKFDENNATVTPETDAVALTTISSTDDGGAKEIKVRFWLEGCDKDCVSENFNQGVTSAIKGQLGFVGVQTANQGA